MERLTRPRRLVAAAMLAGAAVSSFGGATSAFAHWGPCGNDPTVWLNNGAKIHMVSVIQGNLSQITNVAFTVHVPVGVRYTRITYTGGKHAPETVTVISDSNSGYTVNEYATTKGGVSYNLTLSVHLIAHGRGSTWAQTNGVTNQNVQVYVP